MFMEEWKIVCLFSPCSVCTVYSIYVPHGINFLLFLEDQCKNLPVSYFTAVWLGTLSQCYRIGSIQLLSVCCTVNSIPSSVADPDPGWTSRIIYPRAWKQFFWFKILEFLMRMWIRIREYFCSGSGILERKNLDRGSGSATLPLWPNTRSMFS